MTKRLQDAHALHGPDRPRKGSEGAGAGTPVCPHAQTCGACQHVNEPYAAQLARKDARVAELFGGFEGAELRPILGMDDPFRYRNKVVSPYAPGKKLPGAAPGGRAEKGKGSRGDRAREARGRRTAGRARHEILCGMYAAHSHRIVPTDGCLVENEQAKQIILAIRSLMPRFGIEPYREDAHSGFLRHAVVRVGHTSGEMLVTLVTNGRVNAVQTEVLYRQAVELAHLAGAERVVDAYCGTGTIGLVAAKHGAARVVGVDSVASAIRDARENARHNGVENARFVVGDAGAFMREAAADGEQVDVVLMDPPRAGSSEEFLESLAGCAPARVVYISCNPETQARDVRQLERRGYRLRTLQPVDMFPHTDHIETIALLEREGGR